MKFILFVEGHTEHGVLPRFLKRWLDPKLPQPIGISSVRFEGLSELVNDSPKKAKLHLRNDDVIAVISLLDLYGPSFYPPEKKTADERYEWAKRYLEKKVGEDKFFQFFAVHEIEAWLLSDPSIFTNLKIRKRVEKLSISPENANSTKPPAKRLNEMYQQETHKRYKKVVEGKFLFSKLDPHIAYEKCPRLKELLDTMLKLGKAALDSQKS